MKLSHKLKGKLPMIKDYLSYIQETLGVQYIHFSNAIQNEVSNTSSEEINLNLASVNSETENPVHSIIGKTNVSELDLKNSTISYSWELGYDSQKPYHLLFLISGVDWSSLAAPEKELFLKIRASLKLKESMAAPAVVSDWNLQSLENFIHASQNLTEYILFVNNPEKLKNSSQWIQLGDRKILMIPGLALMLKNAEWKKLAWERLKLMILKLHL